MTALTSPTTDVREPLRPPAAVVASVALTVLVTCVGGYGAIYFTGLEGWTELGLTFIVAYEFITVSALVAAIAFLRRSPLGWAGLVAYAVWMNVFTAFKLGYIHETEAIPFGVVGLLLLALVLSRPARRHVGR